MSDGYDDFWGGFGDSSYQPDIVDSRYFPDYSSSYSGDNYVPQQYDVSAWDSLLANSPVQDWNVQPSTALIASTGANGWDTPLAVAPPQAVGGWNIVSAPTGQGGGLLDQAASFLASPGGKLLQSLGGGALSAYGAMKQNRMQKEAARKQAEMLAQRRAEAMRFNEPLHLTAVRSAVVAPEARRGESQFFANNRLPSYFAKGGLAGYVKGGQSGQSDEIPAMVSPGEYVMDADTVSNLGDGNNEAGAKKLDQMRQSIRAHKRSAPNDQIPPKAKSPLAYMKKGAK